MGGSRAHALCCVVLLATLAVCQVSADLPCDDKWPLHPFGVYQRFRHAYCKTRPGDRAACPKHGTECCVDDDCSSGMKCLCHGHCQTLMCQYQPDEHCMELMDPPNGRMRVLGPNAVEMVCDDDFTVYPESVMRCNPRQSKHWTQASCVRKCSKAPFLPNGVLQSRGGARQARVGSVTVYRCRPGYKARGGVVTSTCVEDADGSTSWSAVECDPLVCPSLSYSDSNIRFTLRKGIGSNYDAEYAITCRDGYDLNGHRKVKCTMVNGGAQWDKTAESYCRERPCTVPPYDPSEATAARPSSRAGSRHPAGSSISYRCSGDGYTLVGGASLTCARGNWSASIPECLPHCCSTDGLVLQIGQSAEFSDPSGKCDGGLVSEASVICGGCYEASPSMRQSRRNVRCSNGSWSDIGDFACEMITCSRLEAPVGRDSGFQPVVSPAQGADVARHACGTRLSMSCPERKVLTPSSGHEMMCTNSSQWSPVNFLPVCIPNWERCPFNIEGAPASQFKIVHSNDRGHGTVVKIDKCWEPCKRTVPVEAHCELNLTTGRLQWRLTATPSCEVVQCAPYETQFAGYNTKLAHSHTACRSTSRVKCKAGYHRLVRNGKTGRPMAECGVDGRWQLRPNNLHFSCVKNCTGACTLEGEECYQMTGSASNPTFACRCGRCPPPSTANDAVCGSDGRTYDSKCELKKAACTSGTTIVERPIRECDRGGSCWCSKPTIQFGKGGNCAQERMRLISFNRGRAKCASYSHTDCHVEQGNSFTSFRECYAECAETPVCSLPMERGQCTGDERRYFYNCVTGGCEVFVYGGCGGNQNNFRSRHECEMVVRQHRCSEWFTGQATCPQSAVGCPQCKGEQSRLEDMCENADFAITGRVLQHPRGVPGFDLWSIKVNDVVYKRGDLNLQSGELRARTTPEYTVVVPHVLAANSSTACRHCVPLHTTASMFLMGKVARVENTNKWLLTVTADSHVFVYNVYTEGLDEICTKCSASSTLRQAVQCS